MPNNSSGMYVLKSLTGGSSLSIPNPHMSGSSGQQQHVTLVKNGRSAAGTVIAQKIGRDQVKLFLQWAWMSTNDWEDILAFCENNFFCKITYYDQAKGSTITRKFYCGDRSGTPVNVDSSGHPQFGYKDCSVNFIDTGE